MQADPEIAVITRTKDRPLLLRRAANSILRQSFGNWVWVVVNDGGDPRLVAEVIQKHADALNGRVIRVDNPRSLGMEAASNAGIKASRSRYLVIHDDDDSWEPDFLSTTLGVLADRPHSQVQAAATHCTEIKETIEDGKVSEVFRRPYNKHLVNLTLAGFLSENRTPPICFVYERKVHQEIGYYDEDLRVLGDWEFYLRFYQRYEAVMIPRPLANYHIRPAGSPGTYGNSVTADLDLHAFYGQLLWNRLLRKDLDAGKFGVGSLIATVQALPKPAATNPADSSFALLLPALEARCCGHREVIVCGAGVAGRQVARYARVLGLEVKAYTDSNRKLWNSRIDDIPVLELENGVDLGLPCLIGSIAFASEIRADIQALRERAEAPPLPVFAPHPPSTI